MECVVVLGLLFLLFLENLGDFVKCSLLYFIQ